MEHLGRACAAPREICLTLSATARSLARHGYARAISSAEGLDLLHEAQERGLAQFGDNVRERPAFICNCCGCCCEAMLAAKRFGFLHPVHTTNFVVALERPGCGVCVPACPRGGVRLAARGERVITPVGSTHRVVAMAIERGRLQDLVFDNQAHLSHRAMAAILGVIPKLPPVKQALASRQLRSCYLDRLLGSHPPRQDLH
jgi:hypothetical protein